jgi:hypothetical protein
MPFGLVDFYPRFSGAYYHSLMGRRVSQASRVSLVACLTYSSFLMMEACTFLRNVGKRLQNCTAPCF